MWMLGVRKKFPSRYDLMAVIGVVVLLSGGVAMAEDEPLPPVDIPVFNADLPVGGASGGIGYDEKRANQLAEQYGSDKVNIDPNDGSVFTYHKQDGTVVSKEEFADYMRQLGDEQKATSRAWMEGAIGAHKKYRKFGEPDTLEVNVQDDVKVDDVVSGTLAEQQKFERGIDERQAQVEAEVQRVVPLRTLRSMEKVDTQGQ